MYFLEQKKQSISDVIHSITNFACGIYNDFMALINHTQSSGILTEGDGATGRDTIGICLEMTLYIKNLVRG